jgi:hypothetical protein
VGRLTALRQEAVRRRRVSCALAVVALASAVAPAPLRAAEPDAVARAEALFRAGREAMRAHRYAEACARFRESDALDPSPGTRLNLGVCEAQVGRLALALGDARWARDHLAGGDERYPIAQRLVGELEARAAHLAVRWAWAPVEGARLYLDGEPIDPGPTLTVDPGEHVVLAQAPWHDLARFVVVLREGETEVLDASAGAAWAVPPVRVPPAGPAPERPPPARRTAGFVLSGVAASALVAGGVLGALALGERGAVEQHCPGKLCDPEGLDVASRGRTFANVSTLSIGLAVASGACAAVLLWPKGKSTSAWRTPVVIEAGGVSAAVGRSF